MKKWSPVNLLFMEENEVKRRQDWHHWFLCASSLEVNHVERNWILLGKHFPSLSFHLFICFLLSFISFSHEGTKVIVFIHHLSIFHFHFLSLFTRMTRSLIHSLLFFSLFSWQPDSNLKSTNSSTTESGHRTWRQLDWPWFFLFSDQVLFGLFLLITLLKSVDKVGCTTFSLLTTSRSLISYVCFTPGSCLLRCSFMS